MATAKQKAKCKSCGGYCGGNGRTGCKFAANEAKRQADELWGYAKAAIGAAAAPEEKEPK